MSNVTLPAIGVVVATETASGSEVQVIRVDIGGSNGIQTVSPSNPLPISLPGTATAAKQDAQQSTLEDISNSVATAAKQDGQTEAINALLAAVATSEKQDGQQASLNSILSKLNSNIIVTGYTGITSVSLTRPVNVTAYSTMDSIAEAVPAPLQFTNAARVTGGSGYVTKAKIQTNLYTNNVRYRLNLYSAAPGAIADNALFTRLWVDRANLIGWIDFDGMTTEGTGSDSAVSITSSIRLPFKCDGTTLFGLLETRDAFTPASGQQFYIELTVETN